VQNGKRGGGMTLRDLSEKDVIQL